MSLRDSTPRRELGLFGALISVGLLLAPTAVLTWLAIRFNAVPLWAGAGVQAMFAFVFLRAHPVWRPPASASIIVLYLIALGWVFVPTRGSNDWEVHTGQGILLLAAIGLLALHDLTRTGAEPNRRANKWSRRIAGRSRWPMSLADCRTMPEASRLRNSIRDEASPALALLSDPRPEVVTAALGALEYRTNWKPGEAELVLKVAKLSPEPGVRTAAAYALAGVEQPELIAGLAGFLRDPAPEVRLAAAESLLWDGNRRWAYARDAVRDALADPRLSEDGPLFTGTTRLPVAAIADLTTWAADHPPLARRAIMTLIEQHNRSLTDGDRPELGSELAYEMLNPGTPPALRVELAALLRDHHQLSPDLLDRLTNPDQPGPIRLFAAEVMLRTNPNDPDGVDVLRGLARQPNRELAVQIGAILQAVLGLDLGLPQSDELPSPNSKMAADVARRVLAWANGATADSLRPTTPGLIPPLPHANRPPLAGLQATSIIPAPAPEKGRGSSAVF